MPQDSRATYDEVGSELAAVSPTIMGQMFGMPCLKANGKAYAGLYQDAMIFKLSGDAHAHALALSGARLFDPMGSGRPMKEWVEVPSEHAASWLELGQQALAYVTGMH
jgi:hypothetical protein